MSECPAIGVGGTHSESWHDEDGGQCAWCGARRQVPMEKCNDCFNGYCFMNTEGNKFEVQACDDCTPELPDEEATERFLADVRELRELRAVRVRNRHLSQYILKLCKQVIGLGEVPVTAGTETVSKDWPIRTASIAQTSEPERPTLFDYYLMSMLEGMYSNGNTSGSAVYSVARCIEIVQEVLKQRHDYMNGIVSKP